MNFLAHLWLADRSATSMAGAVLVDVVRGADLSAYPPAVAEGIRLHRRVDALTDRHPRLQPLREAFPPGARRYAGIVLDLAADHALATHWPCHHAQSLEGFCRRAAEAVAAASPWFVHAGGRAVTATGFAALLLSFGTAEGLRTALQRTARRLRKPQALLAAGAEALSWSERLAPELPALLGDLSAAISPAAVPR
jgi:acyl carrier protein phosphodiesterase